MKDCCTNAISWDNKVSKARDVCCPKNGDLTVDRVQVVLIASKQYEQMICIRPNLTGARPNVLHVGDATRSWSTRGYPERSQYGMASQSANYSSGKDWPSRSTALQGSIVAPAFPESFPGLKSDVPAWRLNSKPLSTSHKVGVVLYHSPAG
jgi:hypothetical protein